MSKEHLAIVEELEKAVQALDESSLDTFLKYFDYNHRYFFAGAGRSGFAVRGFAMRIMHMGYVSYVVGEPTTPSIKENDVLLIASGSGNTSSLVSMSEKAHSYGAKVLLLTINSNSKIAQIADDIILIPAPSSKIEGELIFKSIQPMGTLAEQTMSIIFDSLIIKLMKRDHCTSDEMFKNHANLE